MMNVNVEEVVAENATVSCAELSSAEKCVNKQLRVGMVYGHCVQRSISNATERRGALQRGNKLGCACFGLQHTV